MTGDGQSLERRRLVTLVGGTVVALASGTNYVYSAYAPQLASRLRITHTQLNVVGLAGNVGVYFSGPVWGRIADRKGPRILFALGFAMLIIGYSGIRAFYNAGDSKTRLPYLGLVILVICSCLTGVGGNGGITGAMNANAKSQPDSRRATTNGIVISGFGLSAFFFSTIGRMFFKSDTSSLLLLLALGTSIPLLFGVLFVTPVPHIEPDGHEATYSALPTEANEAFTHRDNSRTRLLRTPSDLEDNVRDSLELSPSRAPPPLPALPASLVSPHVDVFGKQLFKTFDFWLLATIMFLLSGTGIMYINNVGSMVQALLAHDNPTFDETEGLKRQADQVSTISICNFLGRIVIGILADILKHRLGFPRCFGIILLAFGFVVSQLIAASVEDINVLWHASIVLGLSYGMLFGLFPTVVIEWFGLAHFSENWGFVSVAPALGGNLFSLAFGRNLDAHDPTLSHPVKSNMLGLGSRSPLSDEDQLHQCLEGRMCYVDTLRLTAFGCTVALALSVYAGWRDWRRRRVVST